MYKSISANRFPADRSPKGCRTTVRPARVLPRALVALAAMLGAVTAFAQQPPHTPAADVPGPHLAHGPDTPGSGSFSAIKEEVPGLPDHVVYRPANLRALHGARMPILAWANGGCSANGAEDRLYLLEIASHGYLVIANGTIRSGPGAHPGAPPTMVPAQGARPALPLPQTSPAQLSEAISWAIAADARPGSPLKGRVATTEVAVAGMSCGGLQALSVSGSDPRIKATIIHNSGTLPPAMAMPGMPLGKDVLTRLHAPILYVLGGTRDVAAPNGTDDYRDITRVPAALASIESGHEGTFQEPDGGEGAKIALAWLDWHLKHDQNAARWFTGPACRLCRSSIWTYRHKGF